MRIAVVVLMSAVLGSGFGVIYVKHHCRQLFIELQTLQEKRDDLEIEWELLQLEQSTLATEAMVDQTARTRLNMVVPDSNRVVYVAR